MSYSLQSNCGVCTKKGQCIDSALVQGAISAIHSVNWANGVARTPQLHLGAGTIKIECCSFDDERKTEVKPEETECEKKV